MVIWVVVCTAITAGLFWAARHDTRTTGPEALYPWIGAWGFALVTLGLWTWLLGPLGLLPHLTFWVGVVGFLIALATAYPALNGPPDWLPYDAPDVLHSPAAWETVCALSGAVCVLSLLAYALGTYWEWGWFR